MSESEIGFVIDPTMEEGTSRFDFQWADDPVERYVFKGRSEREVAQVEALFWLACVLADKGACREAAECLADAREKARQLSGGVS